MVEISCRCVSPVSHQWLSDACCDISADEYCMAEKWHLLELFSRAAFYAGLCYVQAGDVRGAKSMLLHCLVFCEAFGLRKRFIWLSLASLVMPTRFSFCLGFFPDRWIVCQHDYCTQKVL